MICKKCNKECTAINENNKAVSNCCSAEIYYDQMQNTPRTGTDSNPEMMQGCNHYLRDHQTFGSVTGYPRGMSLRDYFAAKAMQGLIVHGLKLAENSDVKNKNVGQITSEWAYAYADAMLKAREK